MKYRCPRCGKVFSRPGEKRKWITSYCGKEMQVKARCYAIIPKKQKEKKK
jgi:DNA-directed RNA polymerase subunit RPC12/RpoP